MTSQIWTCLSIYLNKLQIRNPYLIVIEDKKKTNTYQAGVLRENQVPCTRTPEVFDLHLRNSLPSWLGLDGAADWASGPQLGTPCCLETHSGLVAWQQQADHANGKISQSLITEDECANLSYIECLNVCYFSVYLSIFKLALVDPAKAPFSKKAVGTEVLCGSGQLTERECFGGFGNRGAFFRRFDTCWCFRWWLVLWRDWWWLDGRYKGEHTLDRLFYFLLIHLFYFLLIYLI